jgi:ABC-2 type transport system permease protein
MVLSLKAEHLKCKHSFAAKLPILAPIINLLLVLLMNAGMNGVGPAATWNWWYTILMPGAIAVQCAMVMQMDKRIKYRALLPLPSSLSTIWLGKVLFCILALLFANLITFAGTVIIGVFLGSTISILSGFVAVLVLTITTLWQVPFCLFLSARFSMFTAILVGFILNSAVGTFMAAENNWWVVPISIPARLMGPVLGLLPNGLPAPMNSPVLDANVILPGIILAIIWFAVLAIGTTLWFKRREAI